MRGATSTSTPWSLGLCILPVREVEPVILNLYCILHVNNLTLKVAVSQLALKVSLSSQLLLSNGAYCVSSTFHG